MKKLLSIMMLAFSVTVFFSCSSEHIDDPTRSHSGIDLRTDACEVIGIETDWVKRYSESNAGWTFLPNTTVAIEDDCTATITDNGLSGFNNYAIDLVTGPNLQRCFYGSYDWRDGVTDVDVELVNRHVANIQLFTRLQQYLAADVNWDGIVDIRDVLEIRKLVLTLTLQLPPYTGGGSHQINQPVNYVIGDAAYYGTLEQLFAESLAANDFNEFSKVLVNTVYPHNTCSIYNLEESSDTGKRYAIKRGDINGDFYE